MSVVRAVVPLQSEAMARMRNWGWEFAASGEIDRGDGYAFLEKGFGSTLSNLEAIAHLAEMNITAWVRW